MRALHHPARPPLLAALLAAGALALATAAAAAVGSWSPLGPDGESIYALAADPANPNLVYAATPASVFRSSDGGDNWTFAGTGLGNTSAPGIRALALSGSAVIVGTSWEGVWRSLDEGRTWRATTAGLPTRPPVSTLLVDPRRPERVWLTTREGIFVSDNRGETWAVRNGDLPLAQGVESLAIDPANGQLYARTGSRLFTSSDEGTSWSLLRCLDRRCGSIVVDPADPATLFTLDGAVLRSRDGGTVWEKLRPPKVGLYALLGFHGGRLFAYSRSFATGPAVDRLYWSADQGASWVAAAGQPNHSIAVMASSGDTLYLGSAGSASLGGVFRSGDGGEHWEAASNGLSGRWIETIAVDPLQPGVLYAQASDHLLASEDDGASWRLSLAAPGVLVFGAGDLLVDPHRRGRVWSTTGDYLWRSDDGGRRWMAVNRVGAGIGALAADPRTSGGVWAGGRNGLFQSSNGRAWKRVRPARNENLIVADIAVAPGDPRLVWVAGYATTATGAPLGPRLYRSGDGGKSWQRRENGLPDLVMRLALDPERPDVLFAAAGDGLFGSSDGGARWQRLPSPAAVPAGPGPESIRWEIVASPVAPLTLYAYLDGLLDGLEGDVVYRSRDAGATWQAVGGGSIAPGPFGIRALTVDPHDPRRLLAGTANRGIFTFTEP
ncbi:MAG TPA: hypothetical protein VF179_19970 [Thermoanaerobaculia bacterium]|nr:hypothetical protein [Thermoanaerobaculia bacterium]